MTQEEKLLRVIELQKALIEKQTKTEVVKDEYDLMIEELQAKLDESEKIIEEASKEIEQKDAEIEALVETPNGDVSTDKILEEINTLIQK